MFSVQNELFCVVWPFATTCCLISPLKLLTKMSIDKKPRVQRCLWCCEHWKTSTVTYFLVGGSVKDIQGSCRFGAIIFDNGWHSRSCFVNEFKERKLKALKFWLDAKELWQKSNFKIALFKLVVQCLTQIMFIQEKKEERKVIRL